MKPSVDCLIKLNALSCDLMKYGDLEFLIAILKFDRCSCSGAGELSLKLLGERTIILNILFPQRPIPDITVLEYAICYYDHYRYTDEQHRSKLYGHIEKCHHSSIEIMDDFIFFYFTTNMLFGATKNWSQVLLLFLFSTLHIYVVNNIFHFISLVRVSFMREVKHHLRLYLLYINVTPCPTLPLNRWISVLHDR